MAAKMAANPLFGNLHLYKRTGQRQIVLFARGQVAFGDEGMDVELHDRIHCF